MSAQKRPAIDWAAIERDYRAGLLSLREMAAAHGVSHVTIKKHADKNGWVRDLAAKIQAKSDALVNSAAVNSTANAVTAATERATVDANAQAIADIRLGHRKDIGRARTLVMAMFGELESQVSPEDREALVKLGEIMAEPDENGRDRLNAAYKVAISLPERIKGVKALSDALRTLVDLEGGAWGFAAADKDKTPAESPVAAFLAGLAGSRACALPFATGQASQG